VKRHLIALLGALAALLTAGTGVAAAQSVQGVEQLAATGQSASSNASSTQVNPSNSNISVRIFSPGDGGDVTQENASAAAAAAANQAATVQSADQSQSGGGGAAEQAVGQQALTGQKADANAESKQVNPSNSNISVRIHSPGDDGDVSQSNASKAIGVAHNEAATKQSAEQDQAGGGKEDGYGGKDDGYGKDKGDGKDSCCSGGAGVQAVGQKSVTGQAADADATSEQYHPKNSNIAVRIGSPGDNGDVTQSNTSLAKAIAANEAATLQAADQDQSGGGGDHVQAIGQKAITGQKADADATSIQKGAKNVNAPVRIFSPGDDGDVTQSNVSAAFAGAFNSAKTLQFASQDQGGGEKGGKDRKDGKCGCDDGARVQAIGQWAETWQAADADATSKQFAPTNVNTPVRIKSPGDGGMVDQSNWSFAGALAANRAFTWQDADQEQ
jgi:hypothetical protein